MKIECADSAVEQARIVTLTINPALDTSCTAPDVTPGPKLRCSAPEREPGGGGINVSRAIHALGGKSTALWTCGDLGGEAIRRMLDAQGMDHRPMSIAGSTRESLHIQEEGRGQIYRFVFPGPSLSDDEAEQCLRSVRELDPPPAYLVVSGSLPPGIPPTFYRDVVASVPATCRTIVDTSGEPLRRAVDEGLYFIKPNLRELAQLAGQPVESDEQIEAASRRIIEQGRVQAVVASMGAGGVLLVTRTTAEHIRAPMVPIRSRVGAGDSAVAGIVLALARGETLLDAVRFGVAVSASTVMTPGTQLCRRENAEQLFASMAKSPSGESK